MNDNQQTTDSATTPFNAVALAAALTVKDLEASLAWYQNAMGFDVDRKHERDGKLMAVSLKAGDVRILINQDNGEKGLDRAKGEGFSLQLTTEQNIDALAQRARENGATLVTEPTDTPWGVRMFRVRDLDGFLFTVSSMRAE